MFVIGVRDAVRCQNKVVTIYLSVFGHPSQKVGGKFNTISLHSVLFRTLFSTKDKIGIHFVLGCRLSSYWISSFMGHSFISRWRNRKSRTIPQ